ncbi:hypothetical protein SEA_SATIS_138 [Streptomyces phage Satis]|nr:hypothetical protein SEA_SATIS_138 [Streptomyces phage Satis]QBZ72036.1 hypothetical protein SEA_KRADAL_138 [Streptomyces phage Kradal]
MTRASERVVQAAHPELKPDDVRHTAEAYRTTSGQYGGTVSEMAIQSRTAEQKSAAGEDVAP